MSSTSPLAETDRSPQLRPPELIALENKILFLRLLIPPPVWRTRVTEAHRRAEKLRRVQVWIDKGWEIKRALARLFPNIPENTGRDWLRHFRNGIGEPWQRVIDQRHSRLPQPTPGSFAEIIVTQRNSRLDLRRRVLASAARDFFDEDVPLPDEIVEAVFKHFPDSNT